ncbi:PepSY domain-containing protein [Streptomyces sp. WMMC500]|uniref:PepSY domain-containing protein n=1 Tax=Streptomyces sp. WMMC500 TaxID=3015154 RepID=UPI00248B51EC|nr:PepSY domain-containing protein [Streptomyces sp. WMMC500]WBB58024.1 PepSY domain-containing protein [Streptomyces sp. WMMC500]
MKRNIVIAAVASAALVTGGTVTAVAVSNGDGGADAAALPADVQMGGDDGRDDDGDDRDDRGGDDDSDDRGDDDGDDRADDRAEAEALAAAKVGVDDAVAAALQQRAGTVESAEFDGDDARGGAHTWEIDVLGDDGKWYEVKVDADSGEVVAERGDDDGRDDRGDDDSDDRGDDDTDDRGDDDTSDDRDDRGGDDDGDDRGGDDSGDDSDDRGDD